MILSVGGMALPHDLCCTSTWLLAAGRQRAGQHETKKKHARPAAFCQLKWRPHCCALLNRQARKDKPEKTGSGRVFLGFPKKTSPKRRAGSGQPKKTSPKRRAGSGQPKSEAKPGRVGLGSGLTRPWWSPWNLDSAFPPTLTVEGKAREPKKDDRE